MGIISTCSIIVIAIASGFVAFYACVNYRLMKALNFTNEQHQQKMDEILKKLERICACL
jgi:hypothetical protein